MIRLVCSPDWLGVDSNLVTEGFDDGLRDDEVCILCDILRFCSSIAKILK